MSAFTTVKVKISKTKTKSLTADDVVALGLKDEINLLAENFLLDVRHVVCCDFPSSTTRVNI